MNSNFVKITSSYVFPHQKYSFPRTDPIRPPHSPMRKVEIIVLFVSSFLISYFISAYVRTFTIQSNGADNQPRPQLIHAPNATTNYVNHTNLISDRRKKATTGIGNNASIQIRQCFKLYGDDGTIPYMLAELAGLDVTKKKTADKIVNRAWNEWEKLLENNTTCVRNIANGEVTYTISKFHNEAQIVYDEMKAELEAKIGKQAQNFLLLAFDEKLYFNSLGDKEITLRFLRNSDGEWIPHYTDEKNNMIDIISDLRSLHKYWGAATPTAPNY